MTGQNTSSAVMQQRREPDDSLDDFPTPPWATRALFRHVLYPNCDVFAPDDHFRTLHAWEPACNRGHMARPMAEHFASVIASDVFDYSDDPGRASGWAGQDGVSDFLYGAAPRASCRPVDWIATNAPFRLAEQFIERACRMASRGVAMFVRAAFLEGVGRHERLWSRSPPSVIAFFSERVIIHKGVLRDPERPYWDPDADNGKGRWRRPSTATAYIWLVWQDGLEPRAPIFIPPCRKALERPGDYPPISEPGPSIEPATLLPEV
jgi:hypothetical protein